MEKKYPKELPKGLFAKKPHQNAPQFIKAKLSVKRKDFIEYLQGKSDEWLNFDITEGQDSEKFGVRIDTWKKNTDNNATEKKPTSNNDESTVNIDDIGF